MIMNMTLLPNTIHISTSVVLFLTVNTEMKDWRTGKSKNLLNTSNLLNIQNLPAVHALSACMYLCQFGCLVCVVVSVSQLMI